MCYGYRFLLDICVRGIDFYCIYVLGYIFLLYICVMGMYICVRVYISIVYMCYGYRFLLYICVSGIDFYCIYVLWVYITNLVCYTHFHWFFNPECQHIFGKQTGYICTFSVSLIWAPKNNNNNNTVDKNRNIYASLNQYHNTE